MRSFIISQICRYIQLHRLPNGLQIMADQGFANQPPLILPIGPNGQRLRGIIE